MGVYLALHRRELRVSAQAGCALCLIRGCLALFRLDQPNDRTLNFLVVGFLALYYCAGEAAAFPFGGGPFVKMTPTG